MKNKIIKGLAGIAVAGTIGFVSANAYADVKKECFIRLYPPNKRYSKIELNPVNNGVAVFGGNLVGIKTKNQYFVYRGDFITNCDIETSYLTPEMHKTFLEKKERYKEKK
ncbi:MAG TPA: hypothetical protein VJ208_02045 [Candidatus Nanoarchaeia archaeon]|nr:hypothetical protein [Candidatus Nanoarchaeia archaeon]